jgi:hypothetical protein
MRSGARIPGAGEDRGRRRSRSSGRPAMTSAVVRRGWTTTTASHCPHIARDDLFGAIRAPRDGSDA